MSQKIEPLQYGKYYHIYNRAVGDDNLFRHYANYEHFMRLYDKYIEPVAETFAWVLLPRHFHLLVRIKEEEEIGFIPPKKPPPGIKTTGWVGTASTPPAVENPGGGSNSEREKKKYKPSNQFSHLFNSYTQAFNKRYHRHGNLFEKPFERIPITSEKYFRNLVWYIHNNPVHHGFVEHMIEYPWSSYQTMISVKPTKLSREKVVGWFNSKNEFQVFHQEDHNIKDIRRFIIE